MRHPQARLVGRVAALGAVAALVLGLAPGAAARGPAAPAGLMRALNAGIHAAGPASGAYVMDLNTGQVLFAARAQGSRLPASLQKLFTTSTVLARFGAAGRLRTSVSGIGQLAGGTYTGTLYLRGGGDPTFGSAGFDRASYGTGSTIQRLAAQVRAAGIQALNGSIVADETFFDSLRGTPATGFTPSLYLEGELSALAFNRGWADTQGDNYVTHPALAAGQQFAAALRAAGVNVARALPVRAGRTPAPAALLTAERSPTMATLLGLTNAPSDNFFAETLLKDLGARFGAGGTTAAGVDVVTHTIATQFGLHPRFNDGSGLSTYDRTTPLDVVTLLRLQAANRPFVDSLAVAGETGTLAHEMNGTYAQGRCRGKTGTLTNVSNVAGYCHARDGHTLAYALLMNNISPNYAHPIQNAMQIAMAKYNG